MTVSPAAAEPLPAPTAPLALMALCFAAIMIDGFDILMIGFVAPSLTGALHMERGTLGLVISAGFLGTVVGSVVFGRAADRLGRRRTLLAALAGFGLLTMLCAWARAPGPLALLRFLGGLGMGGAMPVVATIVAAQAPARSRASWVTLTYLGMPFGVVVGGSLAALLLPRFGWSAVFVMGGAAALALLPPAWLLIPRDPRTGACADTGRVSARLALPLHGRAASALALWAASFSVLMLAGFLISFTPSILHQLGMPPARSAMGAVVFNVGAIVGGGLLAAVARRREPFKPSVGVFAAACVLTAALGRLFGHAHAVFVALFALGACLIGGELTFPALASRVFPQRVRGSGVGWTLAAGRVGSIAGPAAGGWLLQSGLSLPEVFALLAGLPLAGALGVWLAWRRLPGMRAAADSAHARIGHRREKGAGEAQRQAKGQAHEQAPARGDDEPVDGQRHDHADGDGKGVA